LTFSFMPFASLWRIVVCGSSSLLGLTPPPQRRVRRLASSARLAFIDSGESAFRRFAARRFLAPFLTLMPRSLRRNEASWLTDVHGLRRALRRAASALRFSEAFCFFVAADDGSLFVWLTSCLSAVVALGWRSFCAEAGAAPMARTSRVAASMAAPRGMA
jgi:hypothetical protein